MDGVEYVKQQFEEKRQLAGVIVVCRLLPNLSSIADLVDVSHIMNN